MGLTVPDVEHTRAFFVAQLGYRQVGEVPNYPAVFLSDGTVMLTHWRAENPGKAVPFDRKSVIGLHHLALAVPDDAALDALHQRLAVIDDVQIEFAPEQLGGSRVRHMMMSIPGGIRAEFIAA